EAEPSGESRGSEQFAPSRQEPLPYPLTHALRYLVSEFLPREAAAIERLPDGLKQCIGLRGRKPRRRVPVWFMEHGTGSQSRHPERELVRGEQVEGSTRTIGLDEGVPLPECCLHLLPGGSGDPHPNGQ